MSPSHAGCAETPISTNTMPARSISERGRIAEYTPIGIASRSQKTTPPSTSENVTGAARRTISLTSWRLKNDFPSDPSVTKFLTNWPYIWGTDPCRLTEFRMFASSAFPARPCSLTTGCGTTRKSTPVQAILAARNRSMGRSLSGPGSGWQGWVVAKVLVAAQGGLSAVQEQDDPFAFLAATDLGEADRVRNGREQLEVLAEAEIGELGALAERHPLEVDHRPDAGAAR